jgi:hypothetical protein
VIVTDKLAVRTTFHNIRSATSAVGRLCCKTLFGSLKTNFLGCGRGDRIIMWGTTATSDEFTGNFGSALEDTSIGDCRLVALFAEKSLQAIFGVLQHYRDTKADTPLLARLRAISITFDR